MSSEENKARFRHYFEEIFNKGNLAVTEEAFAPNLVFHSPIRPEPMRGPEALKQWVTRLHAGFPDIHITIEDLFAEGDKVMARWTWRGTHQGEFEGLPPTGKQVTARAIEIYRFAGGKVEEVWLELDPMHLLQQLGIMPPMEKVPRPVIWLMSRLSRLRGHTSMEPTGR